MAEYILSPSGLRVLIDEKETPSLFFKYAKVFVELFGKGDYLLASDTRPSRKILLPEVISAITSCNANAVTLGITPTPVVPLLVRECKFRGGLILTASHNPIGYNGLKFVGPDGVFLSEEDIRRLKEAVEKGERRKKEGRQRRGTHSFQPNLIDLYVEKILSAPLFSGVSFKKLFCLLDCANGAVYYLIDRILERVNCRVYHIYSPSKAGTKLFPREPEPTSENLFKLKSFVLKKEADLGVAFDPDGDRSSFVTEEGKAIGEELTLPLALEFFLRRRKSPVVCNLSTTLLVDAIARKYLVETYRSRVGERNVVEEMMKRDSLIGGEGNGGVIFREINFTRDGILATLATLALISEAGKLSTIVREFPRFFIKKFSFSLERKAILKKMTEEARKVLSGKKGLKEDQSDGLWLGNETSFFHLRASRTEPIIRVIVCSQNRTVIDQIKDLIGSLMGEKCVE